MEQARSQPSTRTVGPKEVMVWGRKIKDEAEAVALPVRRRIKNW
jgi:hypothetical protein